MLWRRIVFPRAVGLLATWRRSIATGSGAAAFGDRERRRREQQVDDTQPAPELRRPASQRFQLLGALDNVKRGQVVNAFSELPLSTEVRDAVLASVRESFGQADKDIKPTEIQSFAIPALAIDTPKRSPVLMAAETGTGKTIAYLAPVFEHLRREEQRYKEWTSTSSVTTLPGQAHDPSSSPSSLQVHVPAAIKHSLSTPLRRIGYPRCIVLAPSHDLVAQLSTVAKSMSHIARLRVVGVTTSTPQTHARRMLDEPIDVLITTPGTLNSYLRDGSVKLTSTQFLVVDEADTIFDQGFERDTRAVIDVMNNIAASKRRSRTSAAAAGTTAAGGSTAPAWRNDTEPMFVFVTATLPKSLYNTLSESFPDMRVITTPSLHRPLTKCKQHFIDVPRQFRSDKHVALMYTLREFPVSRSNTMIFCNTRKSVETTTAYLRQKLSDRQAEAVLSLTGSQSLDERANVWQHFRTRTDQVLVCTDIASRGVDTVNVGLVINYDFPVTVIEYLHRIGRTARAGRRGVAVSLVTKRSRDLVKDIEGKLRSRRTL
ncbi:RNA helicase [Sorochytrium milnesiophthora]